MNLLDITGRAVVCVGPPNTGKTEYIKNNSVGIVKHIGVRDLQKPFGCAYTGCDTLVIISPSKSKKLWCKEVISTLKSLLCEKTILIEVKYRDAENVKTPSRVFIEMSHDMPPAFKKDGRRLIFMPFQRPEEEETTG